LTTFWFALDSSLIEGTRVLGRFFTQYNEYGPSEDQGRQSFVPVILGGFSMFNHNGAQPFVVV
jgi:hypothetical protein